MPRHLARVLGCLSAAICAPPLALASDPEQTTTIVGSSTIFPYANQVVRKLDPEIADMIDVRSTGSNAGIRAFCQEGTAFFAPITLASRRMRDEEKESCGTASPEHISEHRLGANGITLVTFRETALPSFAPTREQIFLALAAAVPDRDCALRRNRVRRWSQIDPSLPDAPIRFQGPSKQHGQYSTFIDTALVAGAKANTCMVKLEASKPGTMKRVASELRGDGVWVDQSEDKIALIPDLKNDSYAIGVMSFNFARRFRRHLHLLAVDGVYPTALTISDGSYPLAGMLWMYTNEKALADNPDARTFAAAFTASDAIGKGGYLTGHGLVAVAE